MQMQPGEHPFEKGFQVNKPRKFSFEFGAATILYSSIFVHFVLSIVIFASKNSEPLKLTETSPGNLQVECPEGMIPPERCHNSLRTAYCVSESLCEDYKQCLTDNPMAGRRLDFDPRRLSEVVAQDVWEFLEMHAYQPTVLFLGAFICAGIWLVLLRKFPKTVVWSTIGLDFVMLGFIFLWMLIEAESLNIGILVIMALMAVGCALLFQKINHSAVMMKFALNGLFANPHIFGVCFGVQLVWAAFFALWIAGLISSHFVLTVRFGVKEMQTFDGGSISQARCEVVGGWPSNGFIILYWALHYYWVTYFIKNINVMVITGNLSAWYFEEPNFESNWVKVLAWSFGPLAGGNAMCSAFQGLLEYLMAKVGSTWSLIIGCLNPFEWIFVCIGLCLKSIAMTYTKYALIAHCYSARPFCEGAPRTLKLMTKWLGEAIVCDYIGKSVMKWLTYVVAVAIAFAAWAWADAVQNISTFTVLGEHMSILVAVVLLYCWILSNPFQSLILVVVIEMFLPDMDSGEWRAACNSIFASIFMGCITYFILSILSHVVVTSMDVCLFCYAVASDHGEVSESAEKQAFYESIKATITQGQVTNNGAAIGTPVPNTMMVQVPAGSSPGELLNVQTPQGQQLQVAIPAGVVAGQAFQVQVPQQVVAQATVISSAPPTNVVGNPV